MADFLIKEDGGYILQEDGVSKIILEEDTLLNSVNSGVLKLIKEYPRNLGKVDKPEGIVENVSKPTGIIRSSEKPEGV